MAIMRLLVALLWAGSAWAQLTDTATHAEPALPTLPAAGGHLTDPTFGTTIIRITDSNDAANCHNYYSYWSVVNADNTLLLYHCSTPNKFVIAEFNPATLTVGTKHDVTAQFLPCGGQGFYWSMTDPLVAWCDGSDVTIRRINITKAPWAVANTVVYDIAAAHAGLTNIAPFFADRARDRFGYYVSSATSSFVGVYDVSAASEIYYTELPEGITDTEAPLSKDGLYLYMFWNDPVPPSPKTRVVNLTTLAETAGVVYTGHNDTTDLAVGQVYGGYRCDLGGWGLCLIKRDFPDLTAITDLLAIGIPGDYWGEWGMSMQGPSQWVYLATCKDAPDGVDKPYEQEIFAAPADGSAIPNAAGKIRRFAHHRSNPSNVGGNYNAYSSHAVPSPDGKFIAFTSTWGDSGRFDLFLVTTGGASLNRATVPGGTLRGGTIR